jgi:hypothetical protein
MYVSGSKNSFQFPQFRNPNERMELRLMKDAMV